MFEEQYGSPVVGKVLREYTRRASALLANITGHGWRKGVAANDLVNRVNYHGVKGGVVTDLVKMRGWHVPRLDDGVETLDGDCAASEAERSLGATDERNERESVEGVLHPQKLANTSKEQKEGD
jgi:hypothetical protein